MLAVSGISYSYTDTPVLHNIQFRLSQGEHLALLGESGCGKSTLLKIIYGLLQPTSGTVFWGDRQVLGPDYNLVPGEPYMKYLAQDFDLMPFTSVAENVSQFLSVFEPEALALRTAELLEVVGMSAFTQRRVKDLSGGQQQRVALARVLAKEPELLLLDEPFGHIDHFRKSQLRRTLFKYLKEKGISVLMATHDYNEVLPFMDQLVVLREGKIVAQGATNSLYQNPGTPYVASLFGEFNEIPRALVNPNDPTGESNILVYPNELKVVARGGFQATVSACFFMGSYYMIQAFTGRHTLFFNSETALPKDKNIRLQADRVALDRKVF